MISWPFDGSASACAGPIEVWPWNGTSYSASMRVAALASPASMSPLTLGLGLDVGFAWRMNEKRFSDAGNGAVVGLLQFTFSRLAAAIACSSRSHTTAT